MIEVEWAVLVLRLFKLASREFHPQDTVTRVSGVAVGKKELVVMEGQYEADF